MTWPPPSLLTPESLVVLAELAAMAPPGNFVEVGVYRGGSAAVLHRYATYKARKLYLYDTFDGVPYADAEDVHQAGDHTPPPDTLAELKRHMPLAEFVVGDFCRESPTVAAAMAPIALVHVDCDQHRPTAHAIAMFAAHMVEDGIMLFDDANFPGVMRAIRNAFRSRFETTSNGKVLVRF